jgi:hypothetical protein
MNRLKRTAAALVSGLLIGTASAPAWAASAATQTTVAAETALPASSNYLAVAAFSTPAAQRVPMRALNRRTAGQGICAQSTTWSATPTPASCKARVCPDRRPPLALFVRRKSLGLMRDMRFWSDRPRIAEGFGNSCME